MKKIGIIILMVSIIFLSACAKTTSENNQSQEIVFDENSQVHLLITKNFGDEVIFEKMIKIESGWTVLDVLEQELVIETKWDGGFIEGINGLISNQTGENGARLDWFYYLNGIFADTGALGYQVYPDEKIWWDYHPWKNNGMGASPVIGAYPETFINGYRHDIWPLDILVTSDYLEKAVRLQKVLREIGVSNIQIAEITEESYKNHEGAAIVIGEWSDLKQITALNKMNEASPKNGTSIYLGQEGLDVLDYTGETQQTIVSNYGVLVAVEQGFGDFSPMFLLTGDNTKDIDHILELLLEDSEKLNHKYGVIYQQEQLMALPLH